MGKILSVNGPLVQADGMQNCKLYDVATVGNLGLIGEVIEMRNDVASIQVYEDTSGLKPNEDVVPTGKPLSVELAPGLLGGIFDGIGRPLNKLLEVQGSHILRGGKINALDQDTVWGFTPLKKVGDKVFSGDKLGYVQETKAVKHFVLVPMGISGKIKQIKAGEYKICDTVCEIEDNKKVVGVKMLSTWPVRTPRPIEKKLQPSEPMITGQRVIDTMFPIARGGVGAVPGPFGSGKTVVQHQLAKWADADIIVYVGCGERGNEMTDVLNEFPTLIDPKTKRPLMERTVLIANTSDMPVSAREASIYTGITIAEYFRDMGYNVAVMADSTSRFAEALREMSARLEEMPGEEGYPAYLSSRLSEFYERAGLVSTLGGEMGSVTAIGAVSPAGGDLSEPVAQATLRIVKTFWGLSSALAYKRHFPAIDFLQSYSLYNDDLKPWFESNVGEEYIGNKMFLSKILQQENSLQEIVRLVGTEALSAKDKLIMETAKIIREDFLHQNAFNDLDTYTSLQKQSQMIDVIRVFYDLSQKFLEKGGEFREINRLPSKEELSKMKYFDEENLSLFDELKNRFAEDFLTLTQKEEDETK